MRIIECEQGTPQWLDARAGRPTASKFSDIVTPSTCKASASQGPYRAHLLAEWFLGVPIDEGRSQFMERGTEMEEEAVAWYELTTGRNVRKVGLCLHDTLDAGASPDRLVDDDGCLEIKCPSAVRHMEYLLGVAIDAKYRCQLQGQLWVTGRRWVDILSYHPVMPKQVTRVDRDDAFIATLAAEVTKFCVSLEDARSVFQADRDAYHEAKAAAHQNTAPEDDPFASVNHDEQPSFG